MNDTLGGAKVLSLLTVRFSVCILLYNLLCLKNSMVPILL